MYVLANNNLMHCGTLIYQVSVGNALKAADLQMLKEIKMKKVMFSGEIYYY